MDKDSKMPDATKRRAISSLFKWMGRIGSVIMLTGVIAFYIGEGGFNPFNLASTRIILMFLFWLSCAGLVVGWISEGVGGAISTLAMLAFFIAEFLIRGSFPRSWAFEVIALPGVFFLLAALLKNGGPPEKKAEERAG